LHLLWGCFLAFHFSFFLGCLFLPHFCFKESIIKVFGDLS